MDTPWALERLQHWRGGDLGNVFPCPWEVCGKLGTVALSQWSFNLHECSTCIEHLPLCEVFPHIFLEICFNLILSI